MKEKIETAIKSFIKSKPDGTYINYECGKVGTHQLFLNNTNDNSSVGVLKSEIVQEKEEVSLAIALIKQIDMGLRDKANSENKNVRECSVKITVANDELILTAYHKQSTLGTITIK